jgi:hypothetical protein
MASTKLFSISFLRILYSSPLVQSIKFIENHQGTKKEVSIYGQENTPTTYKLAKMNLPKYASIFCTGHQTTDNQLTNQSVNEYLYQSFVFLGIS